MASSGGSRLTVLLLNEEGDQFNASSVAQGHLGGRAAADELHAVARAQVASAGGGTGEAVVHLVTCAYAGSSSTKVAAQDQWLSGFGSSSQLCHLSLPLDDGRGASGRILQLLTLYLPLASVSTIFLGSLHTDYLAPYLEGMPPRLRAKITLVETVTLAPGIKDLVDSGLLKMTSAFKGLFGETDGADELKVDWTGVEELEKQLAELEVDPEAPSSSSMPEPGFVSAPTSPARPATLEPPVVAERRPVLSTRPPVGDAPQDVPAPAGRLFVARKRQTLFAADRLPPYPTKAFKFRTFRWDPDNRPCNVFWLSSKGCAHEGRTYRHDTPFTLEEFKVYRLWVKSTVCFGMQRYGSCELDDAECPQGHRCPFTLEDCPLVRRGQCFYKQAGLPHSEPADGGRWAATGGRW
ncbi:hypothetical protein JCM9279_002026 [Rhodotorula babjevae]